jgi:hypothetical protein
VSADEAGRIDLQPLSSMLGTSSLASLGTGLPSEVSDFQDYMGSPHQPIAAVFDDLRIAPAHEAAPPRIERRAMQRVVEIFLRIIQAIRDFFARLFG